MRSAVSYRIEANSEGAVIYCLRCEGSSADLKDIKLRNCPKCGYHSAFPAGMGGILETEGEPLLLGLGLGSGRSGRSGRLFGGLGVPHADELVVAEPEEPEK